MAYIPKTILFTAILFFCCISIANATPQTKDGLCYQGNYTAIKETPLESYPKIGKIRSILFDKQSVSYATNCYRKYVAEWLIENDQLFLTAIYPCFCDESEPSNLNNVFGSLVKDNRVFAHWYSGNLSFPLGKRLYTAEGPFDESIYEYQVTLECVMGHIINTKTTDNRKKKLPEQTPIELKVFSHVEKMPMLEGGHNKLIEYIEKHLEYPEPARSQGIEGRSVISFIVERDGSRTGLKVARSLEASLDSAAMKLVREMPNWEPGIHDGEKVRVWYNLPIKFPPVPQRTKPKEIAPTIPDLLQKPE